MSDYFSELLTEIIPPPDAAAPYLEIRNGPEDGRTFAITTEVVRIGRQLFEGVGLHGEQFAISSGGAPPSEPSTESNFPIRSDKAISREHCRLTATGGGEYQLKDMDSRFGTELNGTRVTGTAVVKDGDIITIGDTMLLLRTAD